MTSQSRPAARAFRDSGAELAVTYLNEKARSYVEPVATVLGWYRLDHVCVRASGSSPKHLGWLLTNGITDLVLAGSIFFGLPGMAAWAIGLIVGIDLIIEGSSLVLIASQARKTSHDLQS